MCKNLLKVIGTLIVLGGLGFAGYKAYNYYKVHKVTEKVCEG